MCSPSSACNTTSIASRSSLTNASPSPRSHSRRHTGASFHCLPAPSLFQHHRRDCHMTAGALFFHQFIYNIGNNSVTCAIYKASSSRCMTVSSSSSVRLQSGLCDAHPHGSAPRQNAFTVRHVCIQYIADDFFNSTVHVLVSFTGRHCRPVR